MARATPIPETELLKPLDPDVSNENDWPDFLLTAAEISDPTSEELESLLQAGPGTPLTLTGKLSRSKHQLQYLIHDRLAQTLPAVISVSPVQHYCYGQDNDGQAVLWAAGNAGWFQIQPSRAYRAIHKRSCEAVNTLYFLADLYGDWNDRKQKTTPVETIFKLYAQDDSHHCSDEVEAQQVFLTHLPFLLDCMNKGKEGINWSNTSIYDFLMRNSEDNESTSAMDDESTAHTPQPLDTSDEESSRRLAGKSKSSLRPRSGKYSLKAMGRRRDIPGVGPPLIAPNIQSPLKRKADGRDSRPRKRAATSDEIHDTAMHSNSESESSEDTTTEPQLPLGTVPSQQTAASRKGPRIKIIETPLPSFQPQEPGDTWLCSFDGCSYLVYDAGRPDNQELIRDHYKQHALESQSQIDLIYQEERPYLPVNNLIKRIRDLATQKPSSGAKDQNGALGTAETLDAEYPEPIRRKWP